MCIQHKIKVSIFSTSSIQNIFHYDKYVARYAGDAHGSAK